MYIYDFSEAEPLYAAFTLWRKMHILLHFEQCRALSYSTLFSGYIVEIKTIRLLRVRDYQQHDPKHTANAVKSNINRK